MLQFLSSILLGYLLGSLPTAYLIVKRKNQIDIRDAGSRNVGARNALEVTGSKIVGSLVLLIDSMKGVLAVILSCYFAGAEFWILSLAGIGAVLGHNYPVWLRFKGGRGLATTAGVMVLMGWIYIPVWLLCYLVSQRIFNNVHLSTVASSAVSPVLMLLVPLTLINSVAYSGQMRFDIFCLCLIFSLLIILRNINPLKQSLIAQNK